MQLWDADYSGGRGGASVSVAVMTASHLRRDSELQSRGDRGLQSIIREAGLNV